MYLGPLRLAQIGPGEDPLLRTGQWWTDRQAAWIGGIGGSAVGCLGGLIGTLVGLGRARRFALALSRGLFAFGFVGLIAGLVAVVDSQPYAVYYPLLLGGGILTLVLLFQLHIIRRRYEAIELRKSSLI